MKVRTEVVAYAALFVACLALFLCVLNARKCRERVDQLWLQLDLQRAWMQTSLQAIDAGIPTVTTVTGTKTEVRVR